MVPRQHTASPSTAPSAFLKQGLKLSRPRLASSSTPILYPLCGTSPVHQLPSSDTIDCRCQLPQMAEMKTGHRRHRRRYGAAAAASHLPEAQLDSMRTGRGARAGQGHRARRPPSLLGAASPSWHGGRQEPAGPSRAQMDPETSAHAAGKAQSGRGQSQEPQRHRHHPISFRQILCYGSHDSPATFPPDWLAAASRTHRLIGGREIEWLWRWAPMGSLRSPCDTYLCSLQSTGERMACASRESGRGRGLLRRATHMALKLDYITCSCIPTALPTGCLRRINVARYCGRARQTTTYSIHVLQRYSPRRRFRWRI